MTIVVGAVLVATIVVACTGGTSATPGAQASTGQASTGQASTGDSSTPASAQPSPVVAAPRPITSYPLAARVGVFTYPGDLDKFVRATGSRPATWATYQDWGSRAMFPAETVEAVRKMGIKTTLTWEPWDATGATTQAAYADSVIAGGRYDSFIKDYALSVQRYGYPVVLRFAHEMNGNWYPWAEGVGNSAASYVAMWRHVWNIFHELHVTNVQWQWSANNIYPGSLALAPLYPGDRYVDSVGISGYNWGDAGSSHWQEFGAVFDASIKAVRAITDKPLWLSETGSAGTPARKAGWVTRFFAQVKKRPYIAGFVWFNRDKGKPWAITTSAKVIRAWSRGVASLS